MKTGRRRSHKGRTSEQKQKAKEQEQKARAKAKAKRLHAISQRGLVAKAVKAGASNPAVRIKPSAYKPRPSRRGNPSKSYAPELSRGLPGNEDSDP
jgi:hypothetical protein